MGRTRNQRIACGGVLLQKGLISRQINGSGVFPEPFQTIFQLLRPSSQRSVGVFFMVAISGKLKSLGSTSLFLP